MTRLEKLCIFTWLGLIVVTGCLAASVTEMHGSITITIGKPVATADAAPVHLSSLAMNARDLIPPPPGHDHFAGK